MGYFRDVLNFKQLLFLNLSTGSLVTSSRFSLLIGGGSQSPANNVGRETSTYKVYVSGLQKDLKNETQIIYSRLFYGFNFNEIFLDSISTMCSNLVECGFGGCH